MTIEPRSPAPLRSRVSRRDFFGRFSAAAGYAVTGGVALAAELTGDDTPQRPARVTLLGMGHRGMALADLIRQTPGLELAGWHDPCEAAAAAARGKFGGDSTPREPRNYADEAEAIESPLTDAVLVASPSDVHHRQILKAIAAGKHILTEKPAGIGTLELDRLESALAEHEGTAFLAGFQRRHHSGRNRLCVWLAEGHLGPMVDVRIDWSQPLGAPRGRGGWMADPTRTGDWVAEHGDHVWDMLARLRPGMDIPAVVAASRLRGPGGDSAFFKATLAWADGVTADFRHSFLPGGHFASPGLSVFVQYRSGIVDLIAGRVNCDRKTPPPEPFEKNVSEDAAMLRAFATRAQPRGLCPEELRAANAEEIRGLRLVDTLRQSVVTAFGNT